MRRARAQMPHLSEKFAGGTPVTQAAWLTQRMEVSKRHTARPRVAYVTFWVVTARVVMGWLAPAVELVRIRPKCSRTRMSMTGWYITASLSPSRLLPAFLAGGRDAHFTCPRRNAPCCPFPERCPSSWPLPASCSWRRPAAGRITVPLPRMWCRVPGARVRRRRMRPTLPAVPPRPPPPRPLPGRPPPLRPPPYP